MTDFGFSVFIGLLTLGLGVIFVAIPRLEKTSSIASAATDSQTESQRGPILSESFILQFVVIWMVVAGASLFRADLVTTALLNAFQGYWVGAAFVLARRWPRLSHSDYWYLRWG